MTHLAAHDARGATVHHERIEMLFTELVTRPRGVLLPRWLEGPHALLQLPDVAMHGKQ